MNIIDGFVIGMRFRMDGNEEPDREAIYETVFRTVPVSVSDGAYIYGGIDTYDRWSPERAFICLLGHLELPNARRLYRYFEDNPAVLSKLTGFRPIIQSNHFEHLESREDLGMADAEGVLHGGTEAYGSMRFCGPENRIRTKPAALIGIGSDRESAMDRTRRFGAMFGDIRPGYPARLMPVSFRKEELSDLMLAQGRGRYACVKKDGETARIGILPDRTALLLGDEKKEDLEDLLPAEEFRAVYSGEEYMESMGGKEQVRKDLIRTLRPFGPVAVLGAADPAADQPALELVRECAAQGGHPYWFLTGSEEDGWEIRSEEGTEPFRSLETETAVRILLSRMEEAE